MAMTAQQTKEYRVAMNLCTILHDAYTRANDSILTHPLEPFEIKEVMDAHGIETQD